MRSLSFSHIYLHVEEQAQAAAAVVPFIQPYLFTSCAKSLGWKLARSLLLDIAEIVTIVAVDSRNVRDALHSSFTDSEDALQHFAACAEAEPALEALVTRDPKGFATSQLAVLSPTEALRRIL